MKLTDILSEERVIAGVNIVPVIDLCLVLLIILMVTSPMMQQAQLPVNLPQAATIENKEKNISVTYSPDGRLAVNMDILAGEYQLPGRLVEKLKEDPDTLVILRVDKDAAYGTLTHLWQLCKKSGARRISIGTEQTKIK